MDFESKSFNHTALICCIKILFLLLNQLPVFYTFGEWRRLTVMHSSASHISHRIAQGFFFLFCFAHSQMNFAGDSFSLPQPSFRTNHAYFMFFRDEILFFFEMDVAWECRMKKNTRTQMKKIIRKYWNLLLPDWYRWSQQNLINNLRMPLLSSHS